ncbi:MAG: MFS transporter [Dethiobacter sp.]|nr:MFS transporter [Dethiobacter sp.]MBS4022678.1 MFS transporter [Dethiobacter sp.]
MDMETAIETVIEKKPIHRNINFILLILGGFVSQAGDSIHAIALTWWVLEKIGTGAAIGTLLIFSYLPSAIIGPVAGVYVDKLNKKHIIVGMDIVRGMLIVWAAYLFFKDALTLPVLMLITALSSICSSFFNPAALSVVPQILDKDELVRGNSLYQSIEHLTGVLGPAIGGILIVIFGIGGVFLINGISFLVSAFSEAFINLPFNPGDRKKSLGLKDVIKDLKEGFSYVYSTKILFGLVTTVAVLNFFSFPLGRIALPILIKNILSLGSEKLGFIFSSASLGALLAAAILIKSGIIRKKSRLIITGVAVTGVCYMLNSTLAVGYRLNILTPQFIFIFLCFSYFFVGVSVSAVNIGMMALAMEIMAEGKRGRVFAFISAVSLGLAPLALGIYGILTDLLPNGVIWFSNGLMIMLGAYSLKYVKGFMDV